MARGARQVPYRPRDSVCTPRPSPLRAMPKLLVAPLLRWLSKLSHPRLFLAIAALFVIDLAIPDMVPWDDLALGLATLLLARWKKKPAG